MILPVVISRMWRQRNYGHAAIALLWLLFCGWRLAWLRLVSSSARSATRRLRAAEVLPNMPILMGTSAGRGQADRAQIHSDDAAAVDAARRS